MKTYTLKTQQWFPKPVKDVFAFFADASNLEAITPPWLHFHILTPRPIEMRPGALIDYRLRLHGIPIRWQTEITAWQPLRYFVDEQRLGPYRRWIHRHTFTPKNGGTLVQDEVNYAGRGGVIVHRFLIAPDLRKIFDYRQEELESILGQGEAAGFPKHTAVILSEAS